jgi:hypothetical protein
MGKLSRRDFLKLAGTGSAAMAAGGILATGLLRQADSSTYTFRAVSGVPKPPLPNYASYVLDGSIDLGSGTGVLRKTVFAGAPDAMSAIAFPGLSRTLRVTDVRRMSGVLLVEAEDPLNPRRALGALSGSSHPEGLYLLRSSTRSTSCD